MSENVTDGPTRIDFNEAVGACRNNILRHALFSLAEVIVALGILGGVGYFLVDISKAQGIVINEKRVALQNAVNARIGARTAAKDEWGKFLQTKPVFSASEASSAAAIQAMSKWERQAQSLLELANSSAEAESKAVDAMQNYDPMVWTPNEMITAAALFLIVLGLLIGVYRIHVKEIARNEYSRLALLRVSLAKAAGGSEEVIKCLLQDAFSVPTEQAALFSGRRKFESPLPGHPGSDLGTALINKFLENYEFKPRDS